MPAKQKTPPVVLEHCSACSTPRNRVYHERGKHTRSTKPKPRPGTEAENPHLPPFVLQTKGQERGD